MNIDIKLHKFDLPDEMDLSKSDKIAIDCEFMGLNVARDKLCLVQISSGNQDAHIIQLNRENYKAPNLVKLLNNNKINKIFHFARADLSFIKKYLKIEMDNINDTKIASKLARSYSDKHGLKDLIKEFVGIDVSKQLQSSDFGGNLTEKQLLYCVPKLNQEFHKLWSLVQFFIFRPRLIKLRVQSKCYQRLKIMVDHGFLSSW